MAITWNDIEQNTDEWYALRAGKLTASSLSTVMANAGKAFGEPAKKLAAKIAFERMNHASMDEHYGDVYTNAEMERGHIQEPIARAMYEDETFCTVTNGGFYCNDFLGFSPDGLVGESGQIEIKSVKPPTHYANKKRGAHDPAYHWQLVGNLWASQREWLDFISYCSFAPKDSQLIIYRIYACDLEDDFHKLEKRTSEFKELVDSIITEFKQAA